MTDENKPRDSAQLPPYIYGREAAPNEKVWTESAVREALRAQAASPADMAVYQGIADGYQRDAQAASVEPVGEVQWAAGVPNSIREVVFFDPPCPPVGTKLYAGLPPAHIPADASHDSIRFLNHALKLADRLPDTEISYTLRLYLAGAHAPQPQAVAASSLCCDRKSERNEFCCGLPPTSPATANLGEMMCAAGVASVTVPGKHDRILNGGTPAVTEVTALRGAIDAMRVAGGSAEFQAAFDRAKALIGRPETASRGRGAGDAHMWSFDPMIDAALATKEQR